MSIAFLSFFRKKDCAKNLFHIYSEKHAYEELDDKNEKTNVFLNKKKQILKLHKIIKLTKTVKIFIFSYPNEYEYLGLGICKHIKFSGLNKEGKIKGKWNNNDDKEKDLKQIFRSYTPIYIDKKNKHVHFVIRIYYPDDNYVDGGKMSMQLNNLKYNDKLEITGPFGLLEYKGNNEFVHLSKTIKNKKHIIMIAGGTGMTPFFRLINHLLLTENKEHSNIIYMTFIYANRNEEEILLKSIFDEYERKYENIKIVYSIDKCLDETKKNTFEHIGFINEELLKKYVLKYQKLDIKIENEDTLILLCGPPPMTTFLQKMLKDLNQLENIITL
ncbi:NADH-cytochrome b5 reductase, putative [Plasmodium gallinaceum]|uniref:NADH-cytochrome b5 reductase, putative n=1 Tax=Plasmodium gallinaceum TaxID=5849 RepID=A0A1J1GNH9_PLAGA|nr:NADH-cytochrome b5 reductase, putative [Plasmodium gallinaceum]CRG94033.1 NADH-cytochrome b5 reductase, putative [Plasmodium gallinaceum]